MAIDPLDPDWAALAPIRELGAPERVPGGVRCATEAGPLAAIAYARDIFRLTLGVAGRRRLRHPGRRGRPACGRGRGGADGVALRAGELRLRCSASPLRVTLERAGQVLLAASTDAHFRRPHRLPPFARTADGWFAALGLASGEAVYGLARSGAGSTSAASCCARGSRTRSASMPRPPTRTARSPGSPRGWGLFVHTPGRVIHGVGFAPWSQRTYALEVEDERARPVPDRGAPTRPASWSATPGSPAGRRRVPRWSLGAWLSKAYYRDAEELSQPRGDCAGAGPADGRDHARRPRLAGHADPLRLPLDPARYPEPKAVIDELHAHGFRLCVWEYPLVAEQNPLFAELARQGFLLKDARDRRALAPSLGPGAVRRRC